METLHIHRGYIHVYDSPYWMLLFNRDDDIEWNSYPIYVVFNTLAPVSELPFFENTAQNQNQFKRKKNRMFLTCAARSDCDIEPPFEFPKAPSPADWSGDPIRGGVDSFLRGTGLIGSLNYILGQAKDSEGVIPWVYIASGIVSNGSDSVHEVWNCLTSFSWVENKQLLDYW